MSSQVSFDSRIYIEFRFASMKIELEYIFFCTKYKENVLSVIIIDAYIYKEYSDIFLFL